MGKHDATNKKTCDCSISDNQQNKIMLLCFKSERCCRFCGFFDCLYYFSLQIILKIIRQRKEIKEQNNYKMIIN